MPSQCRSIICTHFRYGARRCQRRLCFQRSKNGNNQVICNNVNPRTFTLYWEASSGDLDHYEIFESNFATGDMPSTIISRPDPIAHPEIPPPSNATLTRYKAGNPYLVYSYQIRACNAAGGMSGCSAPRGIAEMCVGNSSVFGPNRVVSTTYYHTDALGSPVAETNAAGTVTQRSRYEPYGLPANTPFPDAPGYTGHVADSFTQLSYMQQRYYDPLIGRFLSVDPVQSSSTDGGNFNRYAYSSNNPYTYVDPDGEAKTVAWLVKLGATNMRKVARLTKEQAVRFRRAEENVHADTRQAAKRIEEAAHGKEDLIRHKGHKLDDGTKGLPHFQTDGKIGHTFWGVIAVVSAYTADALDNAAEAAEYLPEVGIRPATRDDLERTNGIIDFFNDKTGLKIPGYDKDDYEEDEFGGVYRVDGRLGSKRLDEQLKKKD